MLNLPPISAKPVDGNAESAPTAASGKTIFVTVGTSATTATRCWRPVANQAEWNELRDLFDSLSTNAAWADWLSRLEPASRFVVELLRLHDPDRPGQSAAPPQLRSVDTVLKALRDGRREAATMARKYSKSDVLAKRLDELFEDDCLDPQNVRLHGFLPAEIATIIALQTAHDGRPEDKALDGDAICLICSEDDGDAETAGSLPDARICKYLLDLAAKREWYGLKGVQTEIFTADLRGIAKTGGQARVDAELERVWGRIGIEANVSYHLHQRRHLLVVTGGYKAVLIALATRVGACGSAGGRAAPLRPHALYAAHEAGDGIIRFSSNNKPSQPHHLNISWVTPHASGPPPARPIFPKPRTLLMTTGTSILDTATCWWVDDPWLTKFMREVRTYHDLLDHSLIHYVLPLLRALEERRRGLRCNAKQLRCGGRAENLLLWGLDGEALRYHQWWRLPAEVATLLRLQRSSMRLAPDSTVHLIVGTNRHEGLLLYEMLKQLRDGKEFHKRFAEGGIEGNPLDGLEFVISELEHPLEPEDPDQVTAAVQELEIWLRGRFDDRREHSVELIMVGGYKSIVYEVARRFATIATGSDARNLPLGFKVVAYTLHDHIGRLLGWPFEAPPVDAGPTGIMT